MSDLTDHWTSPPDRTVHGALGRCDLTILQPPFTVGPDGFPANDPVRARELALSFGTVEEVLEELESRGAIEAPPYPAERADLDVVLAGAWGHVLGISDLALADDGNDEPLLYEARKLRERFPDARILGRVSFDPGDSHTEDLVWLPDGTLFHASGWPGSDPWELTGDPYEVAAALGITEAMLEDADLDLDAEAEEVEWADFVSLALGDADPWALPHPRVSAFRVRHTASYTRRMEELFLPDV
ncbi:DUF6333 family protein [Streptomyces sp. NPDC006339]|uniref:DUF6333 family protein n=1 Tax=Streptomyces sp. NPDC006339 TaxID=3156755 RepID=UPI0033BF9153